MNSRQRGVALLTAIILVAVAAIVATSIAWQSQLAARRGIAVFTVAQSLAFAKGAEAIAAYALRDNRNRNPKGPWPPTSCGPNRTGPCRWMQVSCSRPRSRTSRGNSISTA